MPSFMAQSSEVVAFYKEVGCEVWMRVISYSYSYNLTVTVLKVLTAYFEK